MVVLRLLGPVDLRDEKGRELRQLLGQPKRLALLAYLASNVPQQFHRRDRLLGLFWPDSSDEQARHGLRQVLYELRNQFGENVIVRRGADEIAINTKIVTCDVAQFHSSISHGSLDKAVELYRGEFLDGFFLSKAPDVEHWIENKRAELHRLVVEVSWKLVDQREANDDFAGAITAAHRAVALSPIDEAGVRRLLSLLKGQRNPGVALRVYDRLVQQLAHEFDAVPSPETTALVTQIREAGRDEALERPSGATETVGATPPPNRSPSATPQVAQRTSGDSAWWKKLAAGTVAGLALVTLMVGGIRLTNNRGHTTFGAAGSDLRVVVFPALVRAPDSGYLVHGIADLLHASLDGAGQLRAVDPNAMYAALRQRGEAGEVSPDAARVIAERLGAGLFVLTRAVDVGGRLRITGSLYDMAHGPGVYATFGAQYEPDQLSQIVEDVAWGLVSAHLVGSGMQLSDVASVRAKNYTALKAYLEGEAAVRENDYPEAIAAFERAIEADSTFGIAWFRRGLFLTWINGDGGMRSLGVPDAWGPDLANEALRHATDLSWPDSVLLLGWHAQLTGDPDKAEEHYDTLLAAYPEHVDALHFRAGVRAWYGWRHGRPRLATRRDFQRVLEVDPDHPLATLWEAGLHVFEGGYYESLDLTGPGLPDRGVLSGTPRRAIWAFTVGDTLAQQKAMQELRDAPPGAVEYVVYMLSGSRKLRGAATAATSLLDPLRRPANETVALGLLLKSRMEAARGRWRTATEDLGRLADVAPELALAHHSLLAVSPMLVVSESELRSLHAAVETWDGTFPSTPSVAVGGPMYGLAIPPEMESHIRTYLLGLLRARLGESVAAQASAPDLLDAASVADTLGLIGDLARDIQAMAALSDDQPEVALASLEQATLLGATSDYFRSFMYARPLHPLLRAESLARLGRLEEAMGWYATVPSPVFPGEWRLAVSHYQRGRILDQLGDASGALEHYEKFIEMWSEADADQQLPLTVAQQRIVVLERTR